MHLGFILSFLRMNYMRHDLLIETFDLTIHQPNYQKLCIGLASPKPFRSWVKRRLSNGEIVGQVDKPYTLRHKTHDPVYSMREFNMIYL